MTIIHSLIGHFFSPNLFNSGMFTSGYVLDTYIFLQRSLITIVTLPESLFRRVYFVINADRGNESHRFASGQF